MTDNKNFPKDKGFCPLKHSANSKTENPFTENGLQIAIIEDLNDLRQRVGSLEKEFFSQRLDSCKTQTEDQKGMRNL